MLLKLLCSSAPNRRSSRSCLVECDTRLKTNHRPAAGWQTVLGMKLQLRTDGKSILMLALLLIFLVVRQVSFSCEAHLHTRLLTTGSPSGAKYSKSSFVTFPAG